MNDAVCQAVTSCAVCLVCSNILLHSLRRCVNCLNLLPFKFVFFKLSFHILTQYCAGGKMERNELGGACGAYGGGERCAQGSDGET